MECSKSAVLNGIQGYEWQISPAMSAKVSVEVK